MHLKEELSKNKTLFVKKWFQATIDTYPAQTAKILGKDSNRFDNPIGSVTSESIENVFNLILQDYCKERKCRTIRQNILMRFARNL